MSDSVVNDLNMQSEAQESAQLTAGALLRQAREAARVQLPSLAAMLKVPEHKLQALEADDYAAFPDHVFMRALAMGMCRALQVDSAPVMALLPRTELRGLAKGPSINEAVKDHRHGFKGVGTPLGGERGSRKILVCVLLLLAAAAAVYFVPLHQGGGDASVVAEPVVEPMGSATSGATPGATPDAAAAAAASADVAPDTTSAAPEAEPLVVAGAAAGAVTTPAASESVVPANPALASDAILKMTATVQSWVKVRDANGKVVLEKTLAKDESVTAQGTLPLSVIVGNAKGTQVTVRGEPLDISNTRDNVARFQVK